MSHKDKKNVGNVAEGEAPVQGDVNPAPEDANQEKPAEETKPRKIGAKVVEGLKTAGKIAVIGVSAFGALMGVKNAVSVGGLNRRVTSLENGAGVPQLPGSDTSGNGNGIPGGVPENPFSSHLDV